jgi:hypothetical protein
MSSKVIINANKGSSLALIMKKGGCLKSLMFLVRLELTAFRL